MMVMTGANSLLVTMLVFALSTMCDAGPYDIPGNSYNYRRLLQPPRFDINATDWVPACERGQWLSDFCIVRNLVFDKGHFYISKSDVGDLRFIQEQQGQHLLLWPSMSGNLSYVQQELVPPKDNPNPGVYPLPLLLVHNEFDEEACDVVVDEPAMLFGVKHRYNYHHFVLETLAPLFQTMHEVGLVDLSEVQHSLGARGVYNETRFIDVGPKEKHNFHELFEAFSDHPFQHISDYAGRGKVCFRRAVLGVSDKLGVGTHVPEAGETPIAKDPRRNRYNLFASVIHAHYGTSNAGMASKPYVVLVDRKADRRIKNIGALERSLKKRKIDYRLVHMEELTLKEQFQLHSQTTLFIAMHGAVFVNMLFMPKLTTLVQLWPFGCKRITDTQFKLANILELPILEWENPDKSKSFLEQNGQAFPFSVIDEKDQKHILQQRGLALKQDTDVDMKAFKKLLEGALKRGVHAAMVLDEVDGRPNKMGERDEL